MKKKLVDLKELCLMSPAELEEYIEKEMSSNPALRRSCDEDLIDSLDPEEPEDGDFDYSDFHPDETCDEFYDH